VLTARDTRAPANKNCSQADASALRVSIAGDTPGPDVSKIRKPAGGVERGIERNLPGSIARRSAFDVAQQCIDLLLKQGELRLDHVPDEPIVYVRVAVNEHVAERDDASVVADLCR
jgi:hypothetical protein